MTALALAHQAPAPGDLSRHLLDLAERIRSPRSNIEQAFLAMGARLGDCVTGLNTIVSTSAELQGQLNGDEVGLATDQLNALVQNSLAMAQALDAERGALQRMMEAVAASESPMANLLRTVRMISMVSINARVATAYISVQGDDYTVFTSDIAKLSEKTSSTVKQVAGIHAQLAAIMREVQLKRQSFDLAHKSTLSEISGRLDMHLAALARERADAAARSAEVMSAAGRITKGVGNAVSAIQVGDSTRQRLEHVEEALQSTAAALDSDHDTGVPPAILVGAVAELQAMQLRETSASYQTDIAVLSDSLNALVADARVVCGDGDAGSTGKASGDALAAVGRELDMACREVRNFDSARQELNVAYARLYTSMEHLLQFIDAFGTVEREMRIVSLNLTLQCAKLGSQGDALKVVAQELRNLTADTKVQSQAIVSRLEASRHCLDELKVVWRESGSEKIEQLEKTARRAMEKLTEVSGRMSRHTELVRESGADVSRQISRALAEVAQQSAILGSLLDVSSEFRRLSACLDGISPELQREARVQSMRMQGHRYTMASERKLHALVLVQNGDEEKDRTPPPEPENETAEDDLESLFL